METREELINEIARLKYMLKVILEFIPEKTKNKMLIQIREYIKKGK